MKNLILAIIILLTSTICSCTKKVYVPVESSASHTELRSDSAESVRSAVRVDSIVFRDTISITARGDTVFRDVIRWRYRVRLRTDTVFRDRVHEVFATDTIYRAIPYPEEKTVYVEKDLSSWQKFRLAAFWVLLAALLASLAYIFRKPLLRLLCRLKL